MAEIHKQGIIPHNINLSPVKTSNKFKNSLLSFLIVFYAATALYVIPYGTFPHAELFVPIITIVFLFQLVIGKIKLHKIDLFLILGILMVTFFINISIPRIIDSFFIIILLIVFRNHQNLNRKYIFFIYFYSLSSIIYQLFTYRYNTLPVLSIIDPNFSGYYMLLFFFFCFKNKLKLGILLSLCCAVIFLSRAYILSLSVFFVVLISEKFLRKINFFTKRSYFLLIIVGINFLLLAFSIYFINHIQINNTFVEREDIERIIHLKDESNLIRFTANIKVFNLIKSDFYTIFFGLKTHSEEYVKEQLQYSMAHNGFLSIILYRGIFFSSLYLIAMGRIIRRLYSLENLKYILSVICFALFLHAGYQGVGLIFFISTLALPELKTHKKNRYNISPFKF